MMCPDNCDCPAPRPLDRVELRWLRRLERVLRDMPERLQIVESGDDLRVIDRSAAKTHWLHDDRSASRAVALADVKHSFGKVTGVSG